MKLVDIAHTRSGDKGNSVTLAVIAKEPKFYQVLVEKLTASKVKEHFSDFCKGKVQRFELPNLNAVHFLIEDALDGGGALSLRTDAQGKSWGSSVLRVEI